MGPGLRPRPCDTALYHIRTTRLARERQQVRGRGCHRCTRTMPQAGVLLSISPAPVGQPKICWHRPATEPVDDSALHSSRSLPGSLGAHNSGSPGLKPGSRRAPLESQSNYPAEPPCWGIPHSDALRKGRRERGRTVRSHHTQERGNHYCYCKRGKIVCQSSC